MVQSVSDVLSCEKIRTRGASDYAFLDLHLWMRSDMRLDAAHAKSHEVKDLLMTRFPQIADAIIHLEPPPKGWAEKLKIESGLPAGPPFNFAFSIFNSAAARGGSW